MKRLFFYSMLLVFLWSATQRTVKASAADNENKTLFKIGRSKDANEIFYEVNTKADGSLDLEEPIKIYWKKHTKKGKTESLTKVQKHFAYGLKFLKIAPERVEFQFVSYLKRNFTLCKEENGNFIVITMLDGEEVELERVFIQIDGGTFWFPKVSRVEVHAKNQKANQLVVEIIQP